MNKPRILIIDDNRELVETFKDILELRGCEVFGVNSGSAAVAEVEKGHFDVVLLDLVMPGMNGVETLRAIRQLDPEVRCIVVTAYGNSHLAAEAGKEGALRVFEKPLAGQEVIELIARLTGLPDSRRQAR